MYAQKGLSSLSTVGVCLIVLRAHIKLATSCAMGRCLAMGIPTRCAKCKLIVSTTSVAAVECSSVARARRRLEHPCAVGRCFASECLKNVQNIETDRVQHLC